MKKLSLSFFLSVQFFIGLASAGQQNIDDLLTFLPTNFKVFDQYDADLNQDGFKDKILVLINNSEETTPAGEDAPHRSLVILFGKKNGFTKVVDTDKVVYCKTCGGMMGDPFVRIAVKPPFFTVEHYGGSAWRWKEYLTFKYSKKSSTFIFHKKSHQFFHAASPNKVQTKIQTQKNFGAVKIQDFDIYKE